MTAKSARIVLLGLLVLLLALVLARSWWLPAPADSPIVAVAGQALAVSADVIDPANDEQLVSVSGMLVADAGAVDSELDIRSAAAILWRDVEMYQWQEQCVANGCGQSTLWSDMRIDSSTFREQAGNRNPEGFPFANARFVAKSLRLGAYTLDPDLVATLPAVTRPVTVSELPPNLAAIFQDNAGSLYSGEDMRRPATGDLRVGYRVVAFGQVTVTGMQRGEHLIAATTSN